MTADGAATFLHEDRRLMEERDQHLLENIARQRDRKSFEMLLLRYEKRAYNLAYHLTQHHEIARDAVQDAMLDVWLQASSYRPGNEAGWILRIVANKSLSLIKQRRNENNRMAEKKKNSVKDLDAPPGAITEQSEQLLALRQTVGQLSALDQQVLALRYAGGLTQVEIGNMLSLSHAAISTRLSKACASIRRHLETAGYTSAIYIFSEQRLGEAISFGYEAPVNLCEHVLQKIAQPDPIPFASPPGKRTLASVGTWIIIAITVLGSAGWWLTNDSSPSVKHVAEIDTTATATESKHTQSYHWDFEDGKWPPELSVSSGRFNILPKGQKDSSGCLSSEELHSLMVINLPIKDLPILVSFDQQIVRPAPEGGYFIYPHWSSIEPPLVDFKNLWGMVNMRHDTWKKNSCYISNNTIDLWIDGKRRFFSVEKRKANALLSIRFRGPQRLDNLEITPIDPRSLPDYQPIMNALARIKPGKRTGNVLLPELTGADPSKPVSAIFWEMKPTSK